MSQCSQNEKQNEKKVGCQGEVLWSRPYLQRSSRSWHTGGIPEAGKCQGSGETRQEPAALATDADEAWVLPEQWWPSTYLQKSCRGVGSASDQKRCDQSRETEHGTSDRAWCGSLRGSRCGMVCRKGIVTLPAQEVSSTGGHYPLRRSLAIVST